MNYESIKWNLDFKNLSTFFKQWAENNQQWKQNTTPNGTWAMIPPDYLFSFDEFKALEQTLNLANLSIKDAVLRKSMPNKFLGIHIDDITDIDRNRIVLSLSFNIPLENESGAITRWYDFTNSNEFSNENFVYSYQNTSSPLRQISKDNITNLLGYCIDHTVMTSPLLIRTDIPHNVDTRFFNNDRYIISLRILDRNTNQILDWENRQKILDIKTWV